ncbi:5-oxoprolinase [Smittium culicis]|uniref:5-oxoprolinase n=1 Tax=Smittium culicis TaxID=133412 RepID=A0A1R1Y5S2_9FUNG|nr:5-oxoprolinase [Smittium culicis]
MNSSKSNFSEIIPKELLGKRAIDVCIDRGGTFTDCIGMFPILIHDTQNSEPKYETKTIVIKLLSKDPTHYPDAPREGIRRILQIATGIEHPRDKPLDTSNLGT